MTRLLAAVRCFPGDAGGAIMRKHQTPERHRMIAALRRRLQLWVDTKAEEMNQLADDMRTIIERTDPNDWDEMWAWIDGEWKLVRKVAAEYSWQFILEEYERVGKLHSIEMSDCRRGEKPTTPPAPTGSP